MKLDGMLDIWSNGQLLAFSGVDGESSWKDGLVARSSGNAGRPELLVKLPGELKISLPRLEKTFLAGDFFVLQTERGELKGAFFDAFNLLLEGPCETAGEVPPELETARAGSRLLVAAKGRMAKTAFEAKMDDLIEERAAWLRSLRTPERLSESARGSLAKALSQLKTQVLSPEGRIRRHWTTPDRWPHRNMWLWDSAFHAVGLRHIAPQLAREAVEAMLDVQGPDGFVPHMASPEKSSEITQPPVLAFAVKLIEEVESSKSWLANVYPKLAAYLSWDERNRDSDGAGLLEWFIEGDPLCRSGESGADNSSRFDSAAQLDAPDFNAFLAQDFEAMASLATTLGLKSDAEKWLEKKERVNALMNERLWDEELGLYMDYDVKAKRLANVESYAGLLPLICGAPSKERAERLLESLKDPERFGSPLPAPTIAVRQREIRSKDMWRGPVWINVNWLLVRGLRRYGFEKEAAELLRKTMDEIECQRAKHGTFFEFYDEERKLDPPKLLRKGSNDPSNPYHQAFHDYGWTASLYVDMVFSEN